MSDGLPPSGPRGGPPVLDALPTGGPACVWPPGRGMAAPPGRTGSTGPGSLDSLSPLAAAAAAGSARQVVPTLTEVLDVAAAFTTIQPPTHAAEPADARAPIIDEAALTQRVLDSLRPQLQPLLEQRLLDAMALLVGNACDAIVTQVGESLEPMLREAIARELAQQLARRDAT